MANNGSMKQLEHQLETQESTHSASLRSVRNVDRTVRDLQSQLARRDKIASQLTDDVARGREKIERLLQSVDELQAEEAKSQLSARRAERDLREEREKGLRLERELEGWKGLRMERGTGGKSGGSEWGGSMRGSHGERGNESGEGIRRMLSNSKGFL